ncbi:MAG: hypothetical protein E7319_00455 [Clostridiales bacterium]|nr:hypothetical protein [Clostridiales bacterium]
MNGKRILALLIACVMLLGTVGAYAQEATVEPVYASVSPDDFMAVPETLEYKGGVVSRIIPKASSSDAFLELAYVLTNTPYIILNSPTEWDVTITGGTAPYKCQAVLAYQSDLSLDPFGSPWAVADHFYVNDSSFSYTFSGAGRYFWEFRITDSKGQAFAFQTRIYETYTAADELNAKTVVGKVNSIIDSEIDDSMSDYSRALALHDWLIYNANYDYTYTYYEAAGVLLYGTGVCDSYARAYLMLLTAAGIECMIVSGTAGSGSNPNTWGNHAWNLAKLDGQWYHIDCTWDDPGQGGSERHQYFCVSDETLALDHRWNRPDDLFDSDGMVVPAAPGGKYEASEATSDYDFTFSTIDEYAQAFDQLVAAGEYRAKTVGLYTGTESLSSVWTAFGQWRQTRVQELFEQGLLSGAGGSYYGNLFTFRITWTDPDDYIRINESEMRLSIGEVVTITPAEYDPLENVFTWTSSDPSVATVAAYFNDTNGLYARVTGVKEGTAVITVTSKDGLSDSFTVTVLPAYQPDLALEMTEVSGGVTLNWRKIPGVTEYQVMRSFEGVDTCIAVVSDTTVTLTEAQLPSNVKQDVYVVAVRKVGGTTAISYQSDRISYGTLVITYAVTLPAGITTIAQEAFAGDASLVSVFIPDGAETIGNSAFAGCGQLSAIRIPASVTAIGSNAFSGCALRYVQVAKDSYAAQWVTKNLPGITLIME